MKPQPIPKLLQSRVNRLAHRIAIQHEPRIKSELLARLWSAREAGASVEDLARLLNDIEGQPSEA